MRHYCRSSSSSSITGGLIKNEWKTLLFWPRLSFFFIPNNGESGVELFACAVFFGVCSLKKKK